MWKVDKFGTESSTTSGALREVVSRSRPGFEWKTWLSRIGLMIMIMAGDGRRSATDITIEAHLASIFDQLHPPGDLIHQESSQNTMEAIFDNKSDVLNAKLHATHDNSVIYSISTDETIWSRTYTYVKDLNPAQGGDPTLVGAINWAKKTFEIQGQRKGLDDVRRKPPGLALIRNKSRFWKWGEGREEYDIVHNEEGWEATCTRTGVVEATFTVPYRPQLFGKTKPLVLNLSRVALAKDEVFLLLVFIYCEIKRQEKTNSSGGW